MNELDDISRKLSDQLEEFEKSALNTTDRLRDVEVYISTRLQKARDLLPAMKKSDNWMARLSRVIDILEEIQTILDKMEDVEAAVEPADEILMDMEKFTDELAISNI